MALFGGKQEDKKITLERDGQSIVVKDSAKKEWLKNGWKVKK